MQILLNQIKEILKKQNDQYLKQFKNVNSIFPFSNIEFIFLNLIKDNIISIDYYLKIKQDFTKRNINMYLFEMSPVDFSKEIRNNIILNSNIIIKSSRAVSLNQKDSKLSEKALKLNDSDEFLMNFQQLKPNNSNDFLFVGVWLDGFKKWQLSSEELINHSSYSSIQHKGGIEGQIHITSENISNFSKYLVV
jgi:hypothetical protein